MFRGAMHEGRHKPLVHPVTWRRVQDVLAAHALSDRRREHDQYLRSSLYCGECHSRMIVTHATNRHGVTYPYFVCLGRHQKTTACTKQAVLIAHVEDLVEDYYATVVMPQQLRDQVTASVTADLDAERAVAAKERRRLTAAKARLDNERTKLLQAHYAGAIPLDLLKTEQDRSSANWTRSPSDSPPPTWSSTRSRPTSPASWRWPQTCTASTVTPRPSSAGSSTRPSSPSSTSTTSPMDPSPPTSPNPSQPSSPRRR